MQGANYVCDRAECGKSFPYQTKLDLHVRLHDNNLLRCLFCPWQGAQEDNLQKHINHHFKFRPMSCSFCNASFYSTSNRKDHEDRFHEKMNDRYKCSLCPFTHYSKDGMRFHKLKKHTTEVVHSVMRPSN